MSRTQTPQGGVQVPGEDGTAARHARLIQAVSAEVSQRLDATLAPGLYLVSTPIGNLSDVTLRALVVLAKADHLYCEDTRQSLKLMQRYGIRSHLDTYHEHNAEKVRPRILAAVAAGQSVALISDAGTPLISDPGYKLVRAVIDAGGQAHAIPGASAALAGLVVSGLPTDSFHFAGFLPVKSGARRSRIAALAQVPGTLVLFEAVSRAAETVAALAEGLGPRPAAVARELTKLNETVLRGPLDQLAAEMAELDLKGEIVLLVGQGTAQEVSDTEIVAALAPLLAGNSVRDAVQQTAERFGIPRRRVYDLAIAFQAGKLQIGDLSAGGAAPAKREGEPQ